MKKLSNTEAELKKSVAYKKMRVFFCEYNSFKLFSQTKSYYRSLMNCIFLQKLPEEIQKDLSTPDADLFKCRLKILVLLTKPSENCERFLYLRPLILNHSFIINCLRRDFVVNNTAFGLIICCH